MYFENIIGQVFAKRYITNALTKNMLNNAYIFEGIKGIGKMNFAKELAHTLIGITPENSPDFIVIEKEDKSHRIKIEQIRNMKSGVYEKPISDYKIYIIKDAHLMSEEAQNAILKTIEEPPSYAIFIFITENIESLLPTIRSRCDIVRFTPLKREEIKLYLTDKYSLDDKSALVYSAFSGGSISRAEELMNDSDFREMREDIQNCISVISDRNRMKIEFLADGIEKYEKEIINLLDIMINYLRDIIIIKEKLDTDLITNIDRITFIENMSRKISCSQIASIIDIIEDTKEKLRGYCSFKMSIQVMFLNIYEVIK